MPAPRSLSLALVLALSPMAAAQAADNALYKCVDVAGVTSIQSGPCAAGATQVWRRDTTPEAPPTPAEQAQAEARRLHDLQRVRELSDQLDRRLRANAADEAAAAAPPLPPPPPAASAESPAQDPVIAACQNAQEFANAAREKEWLDLSDEQLRKLYNWVALECKPAG